ncbi:MAG: DNA-3-methyladenine glycosylase [Candidatus Pacearchaeota archaeon]
MSKKLNLLKKEFYSRDASKVVKDLLGKVIVRKYKNKLLKARILETEAYYDEKDPASRACQQGDLRETMLMEGGTILIYGVHNNWLMNIVTNKKGNAQAVLLRAIEPLNFVARCKGPGLLTKALHIDKKFHKKNITENNKLWIEESEKPNKIFSSKRIGVKKDLPINLRFFIK